MTTASPLPGQAGLEAAEAAKIVEGVVGNAWATDAAGKFTYFTPAALSALGTTLEEVNSDSDDGHFGWKRIIHPDDCDDVAATWRRCLQTGEHYNLEHRMLRSSGAYGWGRSTGQPLRDGQGRITGWYGTVIDADVRSVISKRLSEVPGSAQEEKAAPDAPRALGLVHPDDRTAAAHAAARAFWTGVPQVTRHRQLQPDGSYRWTETRSEPGYSLSVDIDDLVTDREPPAGAANLRDDHGSEAIRAATVVESIFGNGWAFDAAGRWIYLHPFAQNSLGVTLEYLNAALDEGHTAWKRLLHPDDYEQVASAWRHCLETGDHFNVEFRFRRASGVYVWARTAARPARDSEGRIAGWFGIALDIDVYKKTMAALRDRERELSQLVDMAPSHIWRLAPDGEPIFFNKRMVEFLGFTVADKDKSGISRLEALAEFVHLDDTAVFREALRVGLASGERFSMQYRLRRSDGVYRWMSSRAEPMRDGDGRVLQWYGLSHDIDDQVKAEEALRRSERQLQQIVDAVPASIWCTTPGGTPSYINKRLIDTVGVRLEDLTGPDASRSLVDVHPDDRQAVEEALTRSFETGTPFAMMYRQRRSDGSHRWTEGRAEPLRDEAGEIAQWYGVCIDMHDLVTAQQTLRNRERELSQLVDMVPSHVWRLTPAGEPNFINKRLSDFLGLDVVDYDQPGMSRLAAAIATSGHPEDAPGIQEAIGHSLATGEPFSMRWRVRRADGVYRWVESRAEPLRDDVGVILHWYGVNVDIDDQVTAQQALRDRERELAQLVDMVPVQIRRLTPDGQPTFFNKRLLDFFGLNNVAQLDKPDTSRLAAAIQTLVHPEDAAHLLETVSHSLATGEPYSMKYRMRRADGAYRWVDGRGEPVRDQVGAIVQWYAISIDIDDEMRAQEALRDRERKLQQLVDAVPVNIITFTPDGKPSFANKRYQDFLGFTLPHFETLEEQLHAIIHPDDVSEMQRELLHCFKTGSTFVMRYRRRGKDGAYYWTEGRMEPLLDQNGAIEHWYAVSLDIDDEMRAQEALRQSERSLRQLFETLPAMIDCAAPDGEPVYRSQQLREFLGYELEELDGTGKSRLAGTLDAGVHPDDVAGVKEQYAHSLSTGEPYARRHRLRRFDGEYRWVETRAAPMRNAEGAIVQWNVICLDIENEVRAQEKLRLAQESLARSSQAASLAELSASIAHEVNQPLAAIVANSDACQRWLTANPPNLERAKITAERIIRDANSAADVVSRIRALFRQSVETRNHTTLSSVIAEVRDLMAEEAVRRRVRIDVEIESDLALVALDRIQIQQVLINLIRNGMDAMESVAGDRVLRTRVRGMGDVIQTEISDCGSGLEFPDKIFEPFFTTKEHGMGMGLAICRTIIESHGGRLWAQRNEPHGATFVFTLPVEVKAAA